MRINGICGIYKKPKPRWYGLRSGAAPTDLVRRAFSPGRCDGVWVGDITCIKTNQGWLNLAVVLDLGSRRVIGYSMANHVRTKLVVDALNTAAATRGYQTTGIVFHSDRGSQYLSAEFATVLHRQQIRHSVGRVGNCWDNSVAESFFSSLKRELVSQTRYATRDQARQEIFAWIGRYNNHRLHSSLNYQTPTEWENNQNNNQRLTQAA
jgi:transposase InsO family protein